MQTLKQHTILVSALTGMIGCLGIAPGVCSHGVEASDHGRIEMPIDADDVYEHCFMLTPAQQLQYSFITSTPVAFNLHYHTGGKVIYPVVEYETASRTETFKADSEQEYCLMWTNENSGQVSFTLNYKTHSAPEK